MRSVTRRFAVVWSTLIHDLAGSEIGAAARTGDTDLEDTERAADGLPRRGNPVD